MRSKLQQKKAKKREDKRERVREEAKGIIILPSGQI